MQIWDVHEMTAVKPVYMLTGPTGSGKTTCLKQWIADHKHKNMAGILCPVIDGNRYLLDISSGYRKQLELKREPSEETPAAIQVGRFHFDETVFSWARQKLLIQRRQEPAWLIIDEVGPLELRAQGLEPAVSQVIQDADFRLRVPVLIVVRHSLKDRVINHLKIFDSMREINVNNLQSLD
ncbi:MAG: hypothetical protein GF313_17155 [Caldithrix sp.]|nr:hypothetical protein [Caldithrix sp.]